MQLLKLTMLAAVISANASEPVVAATEPASVETLILTTAQMFDLAGKAASAGDVALAERILKALAQNPDINMRNEARFRLSMLLSKLHRFSDAATYLRTILDEQPHAQRVRLELARVLEMMGDEAGARKVLRQLQAGGLPPDVARLVDRYSAALRSRKPIGASFEIAIAPDTNVNRATRSDTLGTIIGDFAIDKDAKQKSGVGAAFRGQFYARTPLSDAINVVARINTGANLYKRSSFNDISVALVAGPEFALGSDRLTVDAGPVMRWFGGALLSKNFQVSAAYLHPVGNKAQLRVNGAATIINNRLNSLQDGSAYSLSASFERALSGTSGGGITLSADRQALRDPGYSTAGGQASLFAYKEFGANTVFASVGHGRSFADARLLLFPERRRDRLYQASLGASFRRLRLWSLAPLVRLTYERNLSSVEIYDYSRFRVEFGVTRAF